ncbi:MAG TPA: hypothetical protein VMB50_23480 [Myxococcales bacterium]|nr:hypothetical protein [Myxococcales bacterium]
MLDLLKALEDDDLRADFESTMSVLSLDAARSFWKDLGLGLKDEDAAFAAVRRFVEARDELALLEDDDYPEQVRWLAWTLFGEIGVVEGEARVRALWNWFEVAGRMEPKWHWMWRILLYLYDGAAGGELLGRGMPRAKAEKLLEISFVWSDWVDDLEKRIDAEGEKPATAWDKHQNTLFQLETETENRPYDALQEMIERPRFDKLWTKVMALLSPKEMDILLRWGKARYALVEDPKAKEELGEYALSASDALIPPEMRTRN